MGNFKDLKVWRKAHSLALSIHRVSGQLRGSANASLRSQLLRSAMSIPANIVEGSAKRSDREFVRFLKISLGSAAELEYHLIVSSDTGVISDRDFLSLNERLAEVRKMLNGLIDSLDD